MTLMTVLTKAFDDQKLGTSGLRKKVSVFQQPHYVENFIQSLFNSIGSVEGKLFILGGDGRYFNRNLLQIVLKMAAAHGVACVKVGKEGLLSTPAVSHLIRKYHAYGGIILSASHNPGGREGDCGIKYNIANGGPAPASLCDAVFAASKRLSSYRIMEVPDIDLEREGTTFLGPMQIDIIDPVADYVALMQKIFDFDCIAKAVAEGLTLRFDALHAVTGPYAHEIFEKCLGFSEGTVVNGVPLPDFGGKPPDPNLLHAKALYDLVMSDQGPDLGAASDGDGDRNLIMGRGQFVTPSDSLAIMVDHAHLIKGYRQGIVGIARSMPTGRAADLVAEKKGLNFFETPTGWKFFGTLLDAGYVTFCGEESFGTGSNHIREKDGLWAVLFWLNLLAVTGKTVAQIVQQHWRTYGRFYTLRYDYEEVETCKASAIINALRAYLPKPGSKIAGLSVEKADDFTYHDPVDQSISTGQGVCIFFKNGARLVVRLSGTGTVGATLRLYFEQFEGDPRKHNQNPQKVLQPVQQAAFQLLNIKQHLKRTQPDVIT
ncbi:phosphoglucomutase [Bartonella henselae]|uniref:phosphoglucomutase (alpha-D-glucose-1,6-bisphosphate-dependent) n=1 Tax=Bartonella henselae TaxID=38323 RepID=X5M5V6_BARHN|nr:alpha-D-glucose phosphate-specific phosphoglucomutase [Bartonella henselae]MDM9984707.1 alpha-D-glucose phosphate-specific phosphoglucomutase [Bartonella henselae]MDM9996720.1 alpha-D-glucose phosphate-specific phosphoglucomutase [Bartonella henselae]OLL49122.1 phosphoglucomutase [Bartonella henselae]OLL58978.1 phosphoglucomutase [Bartonella henselae]UJM43779.1 alpha-D-glucose phosphate-specific phosphoglucomutase [Bartonella henselae]